MSDTPTRCPDGRPHSWVAGKLAQPGEREQVYKCKRRGCRARKGLPRHFEDVDRRRTMQAAAEQAKHAKREVTLW